MSQKYIEIKNTDFADTSINDIISNFDALKTSFSGKVFPTTNLKIGMQCYRTDLKKTFLLENVSPLVWKDTSSMNEITIPFAGTNLNKFYPIQIFTERNWANLYRNTHQDTEWRGSASLTIFAGSGWGFYEDSPQAYYAYAWSGDTDIYNTIKKVEISEKTTSLIVWVRGKCTFTLKGTDASYKFPTKINEDTYRVEGDGDYDEYKTIVATSTGDGLSDGVYYNDERLVTSSLSNTPFKQLIRQPNTKYNIHDVVYPSNTVHEDMKFICISSGISGDGELKGGTKWDSGLKIIDGEVTWLQINTMTLAYDVNTIHTGVAPLTVCNICVTPYQASQDYPLLRLKIVANSRSFDASNYFVDIYKNGFIAEYRQGGAYILKQDSPIYFKTYVSDGDMYAFIYLKGGNEADMLSVSYEWVDRHSSQYDKGNYNFSKDIALPENALLLGDSTTGLGCVGTMFIDGNSVTTSTISDTAPNTPTNGALWLDTDAPAPSFVAGLPVGTERAIGYTEVDFEDIPLLGGLYSKIVYKDLWDWVQTKPSILLTEAQWQAKKVENGGKGVAYYSNGTATEFRVPLKDVYIRGAKSIYEVGAYQEDAIRNITGGFKVRGLSGGIDGVSGCVGVTGKSTNAVNASSSSGIAGDAVINASFVVPTAEENRPKTIIQLMVVRAIGSVSNTGSADVAAVVTSVRDLSTKVDEEIGMTIIYPNGGTETNPATVTINSRYVLDNPFSKYDVICSAELFYNNMWSAVGDSYNSTSAVGCKAYDIGNNKIVVQTGGNYLTFYSSALSNGFGVSINPPTSLPCRVKIWKCGRKR